MGLSQLSHNGGLIGGGGGGGPILFKKLF